MKARATLYTSKGVVAVGAEIPASLPAAEVEVIRAAGGLEEEAAASAGEPEADKPAPAEKPKKG
jgi:hypothetical protein